MGIAEMTLTPEKLDELERLANAAAEVLCYRVGEVRDYVLYESVLRDLVRDLDPATVRELVRAAKERDAQAARIAELRYRVKRALSGDLYTLLTDIQNGIDAPGHKDMANSAIQRIDALLTILEGDKA